MSTADAASISLGKFYRVEDESVARVNMCGLCADAGGGGMREGLALEMFKKGRTIELAIFLIVTCSIHAMNLMTCSPCKKCFGNGGVSSRNTIQILRTCCASQKEFEVEEWNQTWNNDTPRHLERDFRLQHTPVGNASVHPA